MYIKFFTEDDLVKEIDGEEAEDFMVAFSAFTTIKCNIGFSILIDGDSYKIIHIELSLHGNVNIRVRKIKN